MKRLLTVLGLLFVAFFLLAVTLAEIFEDKIGQMITSEVNKQLATELRIGGFDLSLLSAFPNVAANLHNVELDGSNDDLLLEARQVSFRFGWLGLLGTNMKINKVVVSNGAMLVSVDAKGNPNYDIMAESADNGDDTTGDAAASGSTPTINLKQAILEDVELLYQNEQSDYYVNTLLRKASVSGQFGTTRFDLISEADLDIGFVEAQGDRYLRGQPVSYKADVAVDTERGNYSINDFDLTLGDLQLSFDGTMESGDPESNYDLRFASQRGSLEDVLALLPLRYQEAIADLETKGDFLMSGTIKGKGTAKRQPIIAAELNFTDGRISGDRMSGSVKDVSFNAVFTNGADRTARSSVFEIRDLRGYFARELFEMKLKIENLDDPLVDFTADGALPIGIIYSFLGNENITDGDGEIELANVSLTGRYNDMVQTSRIGRVRLGGQLSFDDAAVIIKDEKVVLDRGTLTMDNNELTISDLRLEAPDTDMTFNGSARNFLPVLFADSLNSKQAELQFNADLAIEEIDIDQLMALFAPTEEAVEQATARGVIDSLETAQVQENEFITRFLNGRFLAKANSFNYHKIEGSDFEGEIRFTNNQMHIVGNTQAMGGKFLVDGEMYFEDQPRLVARLTCDDIDVRTFFEQGENFGQEVLQARHLSGNMDAKMAIYAYWDEQGNFLMDKLRVLAGVGIEDGTLEDFEMLEAFSTFVKVKDLETIRFTDFQNYLEIRNQRIYIPAMFIQSNAMNLTVSGEHTFDQEIEYYIKVNAGQVLMNKLRRHDGNLDPKPAKRNGFFNLYYSILGTIDQYNYQTDKRRAKDNFALSERRKQDIRLALEREFGTSIQMVEEPNGWRDVSDNNSSTANDGEPDFLDFDLQGGGGK